MQRVLIMRIKENLCSLRKSRKFTCKEVADFIGVSESLVEKWESGAEEPDIQQCLLLSKLYHVSLDDLLYEKIKPKWSFSKKAFLIFSCFMLLLGVSYLGKNLYDRLNDHQPDFRYPESQEEIRPIRRVNLLEYDFEDGTAISFSQKEGVDYISTMENPQYKWIDSTLYLRMEPIILDQDGEIPDLEISVFDPPDGEIFMNMIALPEKIVVGIPEEKVEEIESLSIMIFDEYETIQDYFDIDKDEMAKIKESRQ